jgi:hypothetical protein
LTEVLDEVERRRHGDERMLLLTRYWRGLTEQESYGMKAAIAGESR